MRQARYLDFPLSEYGDRLRKYRLALEEGGFDAAVLTSRDNVEHLTGFTTVSWRLREKRFWVVLAIDRDPVLFVDAVHEVNARETSWVDDVRIWGKGPDGGVPRLKRTLEELGIRSGRLGLELGSGADLRMSPPEFVELSRAMPDVALAGADEWLVRPRIVKSVLEIERIARSCEITCAGMKAGFEALKPGMSERDLVRIVVSEWLRLGADSAYNSNNIGYLSVQSGRVLQMGPSPAERPVQQGDLIQLDGGAVCRGYCSDIYRNAYLGDPSKRLLEYSQGCAHVLDRTLAAIRPGVKSRAIAEASERAAREASLDGKRRVFSDAISERRTVRIGHGFGWALVEPPLIDLDDESVWVEGMCGGLQMSFGDPETGYVEWEDNFVVTSDGCRVLTSSLKPELWVVR
ncbi:MAG: aminopeptidase P family protein [Chloroflexi bacterium]|nr:aminopeptidase P family protein [Chloroflexota bacterium]